MCRYFNHLIPKFKNSKKILLFEKFLSLVKQNNNNSIVERNRTGGALGIPISNRNVLKLLHQKNSSPRKGKGVVCLQHKNKCKWRIFYISPKSGEVMNYTYSNIQTGGKFYLTLDLFKRYPFLLFFCLSKALTALITDALCLSDIVSPEAIKLEAQRLHIANRFVTLKVSNDKTTQVDINQFTQIGIYWEASSIMEKFCYVLTTFKEKDTYTLICHPVGRHNDKFENGISSKLENRFCMFLNIDRHNKTNVKGIGACENNYSYGRGGNGIHSYSFSVLDW